MIFECPGSQKFRHPQPENIRCPECGEEIEIWTDEHEAVCPKCRKHITREGETAQGCIDWCKHAKECVGDDIYVRYKKRQIKGGA